MKQCTDVTAFSPERFEVLLEVCRKNGYWKNDSPQCLLSWMFGKGFSVELPEVAKMITIRDYKEVAEKLAEGTRRGAEEKKKKRDSGEMPVEEIERSFWNLPSLVGTARDRMLVYAADDGGGSFFDKKTPPFSFENMPGDLLRKLPSVPGVKTPYGYVGMWRTCFAWHKEDMDLPSANCLHHGACKLWHIIHREDKQKFEDLLRREFSGGYQKCPEAHQHKTFLVSSMFLRSGPKNIRVYTVTQRPGEFIFVGPAVWHTGLNTGIDVREVMTANFEHEHKAEKEFANGSEGDTVEELRIKNNGAVRKPCVKEEDVTVAAGVRLVCGWSVAGASAAGVWLECGWSVAGVRLECGWSAAGVWLECGWLECGRTRRKIEVLGNLFWNHGRHEDLRSFGWTGGRAGGRVGLPS
uniref:JmjC domain-containing protein n=1 Tax=Chromera velia CCMP2878 TaxID=1169474 RepID=A0A0G4FSE1_9ALVE|eukprot:Cvel_3688.t1-p1 / transcript=Cvel_3688.t1 / gene=Cvel_3688 / organism=Chromera_velia_CCMP2878 / gene_product=Lysine-specific demethylase 4D, putative / transcript_product=Lysine-specific demethylase 4D, putative / location=Cvel_scaffold153:55411-63552(+) / protein_length=408 / sequence_SO=supercontig / SO=protein_coding / is_pseudo=false